MLLFLVLLTYADPQEVRRFALDVNQPLPYSDGADLAVCVDGSILIPTKNTLWHFNDRGHSIHKITSVEGQPIVFLDAAVWDGSRYWLSVILPGRNQLTVKIEKGTTIPTSEPLFDSIAVCGNKLFGIGGLYLEGTEPDTVKWIRDIHARKFDPYNPQSRFHKLESQVFQKTKYNFLRHFVVSDGRQNLYVLNQLMPEIFIYPLEGYLEGPPKRVPIQLSRFTPADTKPDTTWTKENLSNYFNSFSRIHQVAMLNQNELLIAHNKKNKPSNDENFGAGTKQKTNVICKVATSGKVLDSQITTGLLLGTHENQYFLLFSPEDAQGNPSHHVGVYTW